MIIKKYDLSIIIPYYNDEKGIIKLVESIPQSDRIELIIINDHSASISWILAQYNHVEIKYYLQTEGNRWAGAARNYGLSLAQGKFIMFADSDDYFVSGAFDIIFNYITLDFDIVYFPPTSVNENGKKSLRHTKYSDLVTSYLNKKDEAIRYEFFVPWSKLYKSELIYKHNIQFDEVIASNDVMFSLKTGVMGRNFKVSSDTIYCVVESSTSLTKIFSEEVVDSRFDVLCNYNTFIAKNLCPAKKISTISCISRARRIGFYKMLYVLFYSLHKGYPILPDSNGFKRWLKRFFS
ncbi:glycosyltransferase family 2 protein [Pseudoalteromonas sp. SWN166]|uniref:glycosyltransferase family 2 protein n=1 Tax=Pseudoalteromonas sp. SWN166 TaxID=2792061 RepID=UPI0018CE77B7|nr:glycosyltransferase family 2 protein [Pseudoalteromonas sp. SWN166]MBH0038959.1 glycosyltransferase family 2 protein [Pseudoalteromonas sp. SWN166]